MPSITDIVTNHKPDLSPYEDLYKDFHRNPELSFQEHETAASIAKHLSQWTNPAYEITKDVGGTGIAAILRNGEGSTIMLRADIDALPIEERTGLDYASTKRMKNSEGKDMPVMHACGHDFHITSLLAAAQLLHAARDSWSGTLVLVFQPAEEKGAGARAMVDDGLYTKHKVPIPDLVIGGHVMPYVAGTVATKRGLLASAADSYQVTLHGKGGHASMPHLTVDPIPIMAQAISALQSVVSREVPSIESAVLTVAGVKAGEAENVIPDVADMKIDIRSWNEKTRKQVQRSMRRTVNGTSAAMNATQPPTFATIRNFPISYNDPGLTEKLEGTLLEYYKGNKDIYNPNGDVMLGSEDYSIFATAVEKPCVFFLYGGTDPDFFERRDGDVPINHSPNFAPNIQPTLTRGIECYSVAALTWLAK